jgi:regulator of protease activity HflC (stomatin/prohibitin superfamily)
MGLEIVAAVVVLALVVVLARTFRVIPQARVGIIQRLGTYQRSADSGLTVVLPFVDQLLPLLDMREQVVSFAPQPVITSDNVTINVTSVIYYQIFDAKAASYQVATLLRAMEQIAQTTLRNVMGGLSLDTSLTSRDVVNARLRNSLDEVTEKWGVRITRVELKDISPPKDIQLAMEKQMQAERNKRATILTAEGEAQAAILRAEGAQKALILSSEGQRQAAMLRAEGEAKALLTMQEAQAQSIQMVMAAVTASGSSSQAMQLQYLQMLPRLAENPANKVIVVPADLAGLAGLATALVQTTQDGQALPATAALQMLGAGNGTSAART